MKIKICLRGQREKSMSKTTRILMKNNENLLQICLDLRMSSCGSSDPLIQEIEEKRRADEEQRGYEFERRIKTTDQIKKFNESLDNLSLNAENPWQKSVMEEVNNAVDPIRDRKSVV